MNLANQEMTHGRFIRAMDGSGKFGERKGISSVLTPHF